VENDELPGNTMKMLMKSLLDPLNLMVILVVAAAACVITSMVCRRRLARGRKVSLWSATLGAIIAASALTVLSLGGDLFRADTWLGGKTPGLICVPIVVAFLAALSFVPTSAVVLFYRRKSGIGVRR